MNCTYVIGLLQLGSLFLALFTDVETACQAKLETGVSMVTARLEDTLSVSNQSFRMRTN